MDLIEQLTRKQIHLKENLENRKFAMAGFRTGSSLQEIGDDIHSGDIDPKAYWIYVMPALLDGQQNFSQESRHHWQVSRIQVAYFQNLLHEHYAQQREISNEIKRINHHNKMIVALSETLGWGFYHWSFAENYFGKRERAFSERGKKGGVSKALKRQEEDALLSCLVKAQLEHHPQSQKGWPDIWETAHILAKAVTRIAEEQHLPVRQRGDELMDEIFELLDSCENVIRVYDNFSRSSGRINR